MGVIVTPPPADTTPTGPGNAVTQGGTPGAAHMLVEVVEVAGIMEVTTTTTTTTTTSLAPVPHTMGGGREVPRMHPGPLIVEVVTMEEEDGTMEVVDGTMEAVDGTMEEVEDGIMVETGIVEALDLDITLAITPAMEEADVSETVNVLGP